MRSMRANCGVCVRAAAGLARCGSVYGHGSGDFVIAFSTPTRASRPPLTVTQRF
jgi:L-aminopeptidase/D-esterase-like protein